MKNVHINEAIAGWSFLGLLSSTGYMEMDKLPLGIYAVLGLFLMAIFIISVHKAVQA